MDGECPCFRRRANDDRRARSAAAVWQDAPLLIAVTVLTSMESSDLQDLGITLSPADYAAKLAALTQRCGLDGVVCSARGGCARMSWGRRLLVTPGIRPQGSDAGDQRRIMTPEQAQKLGRLYGDWSPGYSVGGSSRDAAGDQRFSAQGA